MAIQQWILVCDLSFRNVKMLMSLGVEGAERIITFHSLIFIFLLGHSRTLAPHFLLVYVLCIFWL